MKRLALLTLACSSFLCSRAQLSVGDTAPNWTYSDINGKSHTLYNYLDSGYTVIMDISATWCGPCWSFHNSGVAETLTDHYGPSGTITPKKIKVFMFEGDGQTNMADLQGTGMNTQGDWITGANYPIIDNDAIGSSYDYSGFPTFYIICPNRKVIGKPSGYGVSMSTENYWKSYMNTCNAATAVQDATPISAGAPVLSVFPNPAKGMLVIKATGLKSGSAALSITDVTGRLVRTLTGEVSGGVLSISDVDVTEWAAGLYRVQVRQDGVTVGTNVSVVK